MTAIAGIVRLDGQRPERATIERMAAALGPYGRDAQDFAFRDHAAFIRTLLRTLPEDQFDHQPMVCPDGRLFMVFDGRLDNRPELERSLKLLASDASRLADGALALRVLKSKGDAALKNFEGDFALACLDRGTGRLLLARDVMGTRPLFWTQQPGFIAFSTMPKALFCIPGVEKELDPLSVHDFLALVPFRERQSFYKNVARVGPAEKHVFEGGQVSVERFFEFDRRKELRLDSGEAYCEAFRDVFEKAVTRMSRCIGPLGAELSSGLDSSSVVATAAGLLQRKGNTRLQALTIAPRAGFGGKVPRGRHGDETILASAVARMYSNIDHHIVRTPEGSGMLDGLDAWLELLDRPPLNLCNSHIFNAMRDRAAGLGIKALLTGFHGNFTLSYNGESFPASLILRGRFDLLWKHIVATRQVYPWLKWRWFFTPVVAPFLPASLYKFLMRKRGRFVDLQRYTALNRQAESDFDTGRRARQAGNDLTYRVARNGRRARIYGMNLQDAGEYNVAANARGVDLRAPLGARSIVEFCLSIPEEQYWLNGEMRSFAKRAMHGRLPAELLSVRTKGLQAADWYEAFGHSLADFRSELEDFGHDELATRLIDVDSMAESLEQLDLAKMGSEKAETLYRLRFLRGVSAGRFIRTVNRNNL